MLAIETANSREGKSHLVFPHCRLAAFERVLLQDEPRSVCCRIRKKKRKKKTTDRFRERLQAKHERDANEKDACRGAERGGERRGGEKNRDANLPSRRRGQLCANAIPFSQVTRKTGHPPRSPVQEAYSRLFFSISSSHLPSPAAPRYALLRDVIRQSRS